MVADRAYRAEPMSDQPPPPPSQPGQPPAAPPPPPPPPPTQPVPTAPPAPGAGGATWQGVQPVVERPTEAVPPVPPTIPPTAPPAGPPGGGGNGGKIAAVVVLVLAILGVGAFLLLSGDDEDDDVATEQDEETTTTEDDDEETTTTAEPDETTTSAAETTTTAPEDGGGELAFTEVTDDSGTLVVEVPDTWTEVDGTALGDGAPNVQASSDLAAFRQLAASGISFTLLNQQDADPDATLDFLQSGQEDGCTVEERQDYTDGVFTGRLQELTDCGGQGVTIIIIVASNEAGQSVEVSTVIVPPDPVEEIEQHIIETFNLR